MSKMTPEEIQKMYKPDWLWRGRSLDNYKAMHEGTAKSRGVSAQFEAAKTLTSARKILFGMKRGNSK